MMNLNVSLRLLTKIQPGSMNTVAMNFILFRSSKLVLLFEVWCCTVFQLIGSSALYLAGKVEEQHLKLRDVINVCYKYGFSTNVEI